MIKHTKLQEFLSHMPDFVYEYIELAYKGESINTQMGYSIDIRVFLRYLKEYKFKNINSVEEFTPEDMDKVTIRDLTAFTAYLREYESEYRTIEGTTVRRIRRNEAKGINRKLSAVKGLFTYMYKNDMIKENVTDKLDFEKLHHKMKRPLTSYDTANLLDCIYNGEKYFTGRNLAEYEKNKLRDSALFTAYLGTGCRVSELIGLNIKDVDFDTSSFIVKRKGGDEQEIFMPVQVENELLKYMEQRTQIENAKDPQALFLSRGGKRLAAQSVESALKKYCLAAGISHPDKCKPHALRRTFACSMIADGVDIKMVAELMGHKNIEVTHRYYTEYAARERKRVMRGFDIEKNRDE